MPQLNLSLEIWNNISIEERDSRGPLL